MTDRKFTHPDDAGPDHPGYVTRDGRPARIVCTDAKGCFPIVALVMDEDEEISLWLTEFGRAVSGRKSVDDLFDAPKPKKRGVYERWVNIYPGDNNCGIPRRSREEADRFAENRIACIHIRQEWEEGEGLGD